MTIETLRKTIPDYARDLRLNLQTVLSEAGAPGLAPRQIWSVALATALATGNASLIEAVEADGAEDLDSAHQEAARAAAAIMGMNNVYYRFLHLVGDESYRQLPARLRMNVIASPGIAQADFELACLAVSAVNGCGLCVESHEKTLRRHGVSQDAIHSAVRIASVIHAVGKVLSTAPRAA